MICLEVTTKMCGCYATDVKDHVMEGKSYIFKQKFVPRTRPSGLDFFSSKLVGRYQGKKLCLADPRK